MGDYPEGSVTDPMGADAGSYRVFRGGGWSDSPLDARSASRYGSTSGFRSSGLGFRVAFSQSR